MEAKDFTSAPGATMETVREKAAKSVRHFVTYLNNAMKDARARGLDIHLRVENEGDHKRSEVKVLNILCHETKRY